MINFCSWLQATVVNTSWCIHKMVAQIRCASVREIRYVLKFDFNSEAAVDFDNCLKQIELPYSLHPCAPYSEHPSYINTMEYFVFAISKIF